jgi:hypothetical protein
LTDATDPLDILVDDLLRFRHDPLGWVLWAFPWGEAGTELEKETGPDTWQREHLDYIGRCLRGEEPGYTPGTPIRTLTVSGHGVGKSCDVAWLVLWAETTAEDTKGVVTANTALQLKTKTWAELAKWYNLLDPLLRQQFEKTATALYSNDEGHDQTWRIEAIPNSPENPAAFAGAHNAGKRLLIIFDEASEIDQAIWETIEGATTDADTEIVFCVYGNPTAPIGRFRECAEGRFRHQWKIWHIDNRTVKRTNKVVLQEMIDTYGLDSDFVRVRVLGQFPRVGAVQLIPSDVVSAARTRIPVHVPSQPLVLGVDCARYGDDASVLAPRRGLDAKTIPWEKYRGLSSMQLVAKILEFNNKYGPDAIMVDDGNIGAAVIDRLMELNVRNVFPVSFGGEGVHQMDYGNEPIIVANTRARIWCSVRRWLYMGGCLPDDPEIETDLTGVQYGYGPGESILLEKKEHMKARGLASPDNGDALACTFTYPVAPRAWSNPNIPGSGSQGPRPVVEVGDYDLYADLR